MTDRVSLVAPALALLKREFSGSAVQYVDRVFEAWRTHLDPALHIVIVLAVANRGVAIHPGSKWATLGVERQVVKNVIDSSAFGSLARSEDYDGALVALVRDVRADLLARLAQQRSWENGIADGIRETSASTALFATRLRDSRFSSKAALHAVHASAHA